MMDATFSRMLGFNLSRQMRSVLALCAVLLGGPGAGLAAEPLNFQEVYNLLKSNLAGVTEPELNEAAAKGLLDRLAGKAVLVGGDTSAAPGGSGAAVSSEIFDQHFGYLRIRVLGAGVDKEFQSAFERLSRTNQLKGLVLDLRFASGQDYGVAVAVANRFFASEQKLVDWGEGWKNSTAKTDAITLPVAVLVNRKTTGAAEALAGMLRHRDIGLLIGTNTAGQASMAKEFTLKTGQKLRVAVAPLKVADGKELPFTGVKPDIEVVVGPEDELAWFDDAFKVITKPVRIASASTNDTTLSATNRPARRRLNEAELVRMSREGQSSDREPNLTNSPGRLPEPPVQVVNDPALARALDLLKGLAVVQQFRSI